MKHPEYVLFFDNHTMQACYNVGHDFDAETFAASVKEVGAELVGFPAKCNQGFCYYDTKIGIRHPSMKPGHDYFGDLVAACNKVGVKVTAYLNCGLSNEDGVVHPEWCQIGKNGEFFHPEIINSMITPYARIMCINSPYRQYILSLIKEVKEKYPVSGFLLDSFNAFPCYCRHCMEGMRKLGMNPENDNEVAEYALISAKSLGAEISEIVQPRRDGLLMYCLGLSARDNLKYGSYLECECLPTYPTWGYDALPIRSRYLRTVSNGEPVFNMTGRFYAWGDFGSLRTDAAIEYDLFYGLANGMRPNIGDHIHPSGVYHRGIVERLKKVYGTLKQYDPWYRGAVNPVDLAVLFSGIAATTSTKSAVRMLCELKMQFDCIDELNDWSKYKVIVLPDDILLTESLRAKVAEFLKNGGKILATGESGLDPEKKAFCFEQEWGVRFKKDKTFDPAYFTMTGDFKDLVPALPLSVNSDCVEAEVLPGTVVAGKVIAPYYDHKWDGVYSFFYTPPDKMTELPFVTMTDQVSYCSGQLFDGYNTAASVELRNVFKAMLLHLLPDPLLQTESGLPSFARAIVSEQPGRRMVHLLNYLPEKRGEMLIVEEAVEAFNIKLKLRLDGKNVKRVVLAPEEKEIPFVQENDHVRFTVPEICGYGLAAVEFAD